METLVQLYANNPNVPHNSLQPEIIRLNSAFIAFTASIIILRILVRARIVKHVALEDYLMVAAGLFATAFSAMNIVGTYPLFPHPTNFQLTQQKALATASADTSTTSPPPRSSRT